MHVTYVSQLANREKKVKMAVKLMLLDKFMGVRCLVFLYYVVEFLLKID